MLPILHLSFVVPVRNDASGIERCLNAIVTAAQGRPYEIIVIDNRSVDGSGERASAVGATVIPADGRVARLRNLGAKAGRGALLAFVDADHEIGADWARAAVESFEHDAVGAVGAPYHPPPTANWVQRSYNLLRDHRPGVREASWLGSGNLVVRRESFEAVGGFDETLETCEDVDLCQRLRRAGFRVVSDSRLRSTHHGDPSTLRGLFSSELWRGRDNLRVSMREPALRELPSVAIPILDLVAGCVGLISIAFWRRHGLVVALGAVVLIIGLSSLRAGRMTSRLHVATIKAWLQATCVALLYDIARALALVVRMPHRRVAGPLASE